MSSKSTVSLKPSQILRAAKAKIENPENWIQGSAAIDRDGMNCDPDSLAAVAWCSLGAFYSIRSTSYKDAGYSFLERSISKSGVPGVANFNDTHSHAEVMSLWDKAISLSERKEQ